VSERYHVNSEEVTSKIVDGEAIIINLSNGAYYSLAGSGALAWALLQRGSSAEEIAADLAARYDADSADVDTDVRRLLETLAEERLVVAGEPAGTPPALEADVAAGGTYEAPQLEKYSDMSDLLALDPPMPGIRDIPWQAPDSRS
jgi:Coenzyme PQQ synthesis protein D (PqqD)